MKYSFNATPDDMSAIVGTAISKTRIVMAIAKTPSVIAECLSLTTLIKSFFAINNRYCLLFYLIIMQML